MQLLRRYRLPGLCVGSQDDEDDVNSRNWQAAADTLNLSIAWDIDEAAPYLRGEHVATPAIIVVDGGASSDELSACTQSSLAFFATIREPMCRQIVVTAKRQMPSLRSFMRLHGSFSWCHPEACRRRCPLMSN